jgi:uncharacterized membrane protein
MLCVSQSSDGTHIMTLKGLLQGKRISHPLHPALVHIPMGLWPAALIFDLITFFGPSCPPLVHASFWCICGGILGALPAIPTGLADWWDIKPDKPARKLGLLHAGLNTIVFLLFLAGMCMRIVAGLDRDRVDLVSFVLCFIAVVLLLISGYVGGRMVYAHGIGIARNSKAKWRQMALDGGANVPTE